MTMLHICHKDLYTACPHPPPPPTPPPLLTIIYELSWIVDKVFAIQASHVAFPLLLPALLVPPIESYAQAFYELFRTVSIFL